MEDQTIKYPVKLENVEYICKFLKVFEKILEDISSIYFAFINSLLYTLCW